MKGLRLNEIYSAPQGEGPRTGIMTQFVRFAGCNMRCPGWPCDTQHAIEPRLYLNDGQTRMVTPTELVQLIADQCDETGAENICFTGGEPFLQPNEMLGEVVMALSLQKRSELGLPWMMEVFTNGSFPFPSWVREHGVVVNLDWKLPGSGEAHTGIDNRWENFKHLTVVDNVKYVVKNLDDFHWCRGLFDEQYKINPRPQFWIGRAWGTLSDADIVDLVKQYRLPWRLNVQTHKHIYDPEARRT